MLSILRIKINYLYPLNNKKHIILQKKDNEKYSKHKTKESSS